MLRLNDGMLLYHGSYTEVTTIDLARCRPGKDFGRGFYLTSSRAQAQAFVPLALRRQRDAHASEPVPDHGYVMTFRYHESDSASIHYFDQADRHWLHFVAANRRSDLFPEILQRYASHQIIGGKIANDRTARTLQLYVSEAYGKPGTQEADDIAIATLLPNRLEDQFCVRTAEAVRQFEYVGSEPYALL